MSLVLQRYLETLKLCQQASSAGDIAKEDELISELDDLWLRMTDQERYQADSTATVIVN